jgi:hypothetical protein
MHAPIGYGSLSRELGRRIPALRNEVEREFVRAGGEDPGPHVVFGNVLVPWLEGLLARPGTDAGLALAFQLLEDMAENPDLRVQEVVQMTVCEDLGASPELLMRARALMWPATRELSLQIEAFLDRIRRESGEPPI